MFVFVDFVDFVVEEEKLFEIEVKVDVCVFVEFTYDIFEVALFLHDFIPGLFGVLQVDVVVFVVVMNRELFQ